MPKEYLPKIIVDYRLDTYLKLGLCHITIA